MSKINVATIRAHYVPKSDRQGVLSFISRSVCECVFDWRRAVITSTYRCNICLFVYLLSNAANDSRSPVFPKCAVINRKCAAIILILCTFCAMHYGYFHISFLYNSIFGIVKYDKSESFLFLGIVPFSNI